MDYHILHRNMLLYLSIPGPLYTQGRVVEELKIVFRIENEIFNFSERNKLLWLKKRKQKSSYLGYKQCRMDRLYSQVYNYIFPCDSLECSQHFVHTHKDRHTSHFYKLMSYGNLGLLNILVFYIYHKDFLCDLANRYILDDDFWYYIPH